jgi:hypothetical protein
MDFWLNTFLVTTAVLTLVMFYAVYEGNNRNV